MSKNLEINPEYLKALDEHAKAIQLAADTYKKIQETPPLIMSEKDE